jgi:hypothetical protein
MLTSERVQRLFNLVPPAHIPELLSAFSDTGTIEQRVAAVEAVLRAAGQTWRDEVGEWIAELLSAESLVPDSFSHWRPLVHDCMAFVASHISNARLAPKIVEQIELPADTPPETRLGLVIAKTPGLQKLGQVLARTRKLSLSLREELQKLENGIADSNIAEIRGHCEPPAGSRAECLQSGDRRSIAVGGERQRDRGLHVVEPRHW